MSLFPFPTVNTVPDGNAEGGWTMLALAEMRVRVRRRGLVLSSKVSRCIGLLTLRQNGRAGTRFISPTPFLFPF